MYTGLRQEKRNLWRFGGSSVPPAAFDALEPHRRWAGSSSRIRAVPLAAPRTRKRWPSSTEIEDAQRNFYLHVLWLYAPYEEQKRARAWDRTRRYSARDAERFADETGAYAGRWVAVKDQRVLHSGASPRDVVLYLREHNLRADSLFRVPVDPEHDQSDNT